jgi:unsaturated rhamnogalacturonyl hydrolase
MEPFAFESAGNIGGTHNLAEVVQAKPVALPPNRRIPYKWKAFAVVPMDKGEDVQLRWSIVDSFQAAGRLRLGSAWDCRPGTVLEVLLAGSQRSLGVIEMIPRSCCAIYELLLSPEDTQATETEGVRLRLVKGSEPHWFFHEENPSPDGRAALMPHLIFEGQSFPLAEFYNRMASLSSLQPFGLREGCVLDGLWSLRQGFGVSSFRPALDAHLRMYFDSSGRLSQEQPMNIASDGILWSVRGLLPFATLARVLPQHPSLNFGLRFLRSHLNFQGSIQDVAMTMEDCYTVAYPLAVIGRLRRNQFLIEQSIAQLRLRKTHLTTADEFYQHAGPEDQKANRNWLRGIGWYLLGLVKSLAEMGTQAPGDLKEEVQRVAQYCLERQKPDGQWSAFIDQPECYSEAYGSAAIAAALVQGQTAGLLPPTVLKPARHTVASLLKQLTPDGFLATPVALPATANPSTPNARLISQAAMGLLAQAMGILGKSK